MADETTVVEPKPFWQSKTLWLNVVGVFWILFADKLGLPKLDEGTEASILAVANMLLRLITKSPVAIS